MHVSSPFTPTSGLSLTGDLPPPPLFFPHKNKIHPLKTAAHIVVIDKLNGATVEGD